MIPFQLYANGNAKHTQAQEGWRAKQKEVGKKELQGGKIYF